MQLRPLRGQRYLTSDSAIRTGEFIQRKLPLMDYQQTYDWYRASYRHDIDKPARALLGCNDRFFLLSIVLGRRDVEHPWLFNRCREVERDPDGHIDLWARYHYKLLWVNEPVPTPSGMRPHGDLKPGDEVFGPDGKPAKVIACTKVKSDADCYRLTFDKGYTVVAGGEHLWTVEIQSRKRLAGGGREGRRTVTVNTRELLGLVVSAKVLSTKTDPMIPVCAPLQFSEQKLSVEPYTMGAWLGDGTSENGYVTCGDKEVFRRIGKSYVLGADKTPHRNAQYRSIAGLSALLKEIGIRGKGKKRIPEQYQLGSVAQRVALLQGLMDTDGHCDTRGTATFVNTNETLARDVFRLCSGLGLKPSLRQHIGTYKDAPYPFWHVSFQAQSKHFNVFGLRRKQSRATASGTLKRRSGYHRVVDVVPVPSVPCSCIQVDRPDGQYLVGEHCIATHNSTIITFGGAIQEVLCDPEIKISIFSVVKPIAQEFLSQIKQELESNIHLKELYSDVLWDNPKSKVEGAGPTKWGIARGITVKRHSNPKEATIEAHGLLDGQPTSRHFDLHIYDDVVTQDYISEDQIKKTTERWELADNLGTHHGVRKQMAGTHYHFADTYIQIIDRKALKPRKYPATDDGTLTGKPIFLSVENWARIKRDQRKVVAAQMLLNPVAAGEATFDASWFHTYEVIPSVLNVYIMVDPSKGATQRSDRTAIAVIGVDLGGNKYLLDGVCHRMKLSERWDYLKQLHEKWERHPGVQFVKVGYEQYGKDIEIEVITDIQERQGKFFEIEELGSPRRGKFSKIDRIERLEPDIRGGQFHLPVSIYNPDFAATGGACYWSVWRDEDHNKFAAETAASDDPGRVCPYFVGQIIYRPARGPTKQQRWCEQTAQRYRIAQPLKRRDENGDIYDVTRIFITEAIQHPYSVHDDFIDASARVYDMEPERPQQFEASAIEGLPEDGYGIDTGNQFYDA